MCLKKYCSAVSRHQRRVTRFRSLNGGALRLFACFDAGKCKWTAVRCSLLEKAKRGRFQSESAFGHASM